MSAPHHPGGAAPHGFPLCAAIANPVLVVMGVSGTGKSTVAGLLAGRLRWDLAEGDDLHPAANVAKMAAGHALTDDDRRPWLDRIADWITERTNAERPGIITCSALARKYRDRIRTGNVIFVHLTGPPELIADRLGARHDHFMPATLLRSQLELLEAPEGDEPHLTLDIRRRPPDLAADVVQALAPGKHEPTAADVRQPR